MDAASQSMSIRRTQQRRDHLLCTSGVTVSQATRRPGPSPLAAAFESAAANGLELTPLPPCAIRFVLNMTPGWQSPSYTG